MAKKGLGDWLRTRRKEELGLSLDQVQTRTGGVVESSYLSKIERGLVQPSATILMALAPVMQIDIQELYRIAGYLPEGATAFVVPASEGGPLEAIELAMRKAKVKPEKRRAVLTVMKSVLDDIDD